MAGVTNLALYPIGTSALAPLSRNAGDLDKLLNASGTVINRAGGTLTSWNKLEADFGVDADAAIARYAVVNGTGDWVTATDYSKNDVWTHTTTGALYIVLADYTSGASESDDISGGNVALYQGNYQDTALGRTELAAKPVLYAGQTVFLSEGGRSGTFIWTLGDFTAEVAADTLQGVYVESDSVAASVGVWKRKLDGFVTPEMFGAVGDGVIDDAMPLNEASAFRLRVGVSLALNANYATSVAFSYEEDVGGALYCLHGARITRTNLSGEVMRWSGRSSTINGVLWLEYDSSLSPTILDTQAVGLLFTGLARSHADCIRIQHVGLGLKIEQSEGFAYTAQNALFSVDIGLSLIHI